MSNALKWALLLAVSGCSHAQRPTPWSPSGSPTLAEQSSGTTALLQAVSAVDDQTAWISGHRATWARTTDGGATWRAGSMSGPDSVLQFRDVHAVSANVAYLLAAGPGDRSRIYKTTDGGTAWQLQFRNTDTSAFFDCFDFWDAAHGIAVSDAVRGRLIVVGTDDGGAHWTDRSAGLPAALAGEGAFAASGTCLVAHGEREAWIGSAGAAGSRVYHTRDRGRTWTMASVPVVTGEATGVASLAFHDARNGLALGGKIGDANDRSDNVAVTDDGGRTWRVAGRPTFSGAVFGSAALGGRTVLAAGPKGLDVSDDDGNTWRSLSTNAYWAVGMAHAAGWAVGPGGRVTKITWLTP